MQQKLTDFFSEAAQASSDSTITIEKMSGLFIMCGCGMGLGFIVMICEYCSAACRDVNQLQNNEVSCKVVVKVQLDL